MRRLWQKYAGKFDAMSVRERVMIAVACLGGIGLLGETLFIEPLLARQAGARRQIEQQGAELAGVEAQRAVARSRLQDPDAANRAALDAARKQVAAIDLRLKGMEKTLVAPDRAAGLLEDILRHNRGLRLVTLRTLPVAALVERKEAAPEAGAAAAARPVLAGAEGSIFKHGVEITVQGSYADLLAYLSQLEQLPQQMFWSKVELTVGEHPYSTLTLTVYTLSLDKAWLVV